MVDGNKKYLLFNIGCIECGVSSAVVGVFSCRADAEARADRLQDCHGWRGGGQNSFEVFELPDEMDVQAPEYD